MFEGTLMLNFHTIQNESGGKEVHSGMYIERGLS